MNCSEFLAQLGDFLDNQVPTGLVADLQAHLEDCEHCPIEHAFLIRSQFSTHDPFASKRKPW